MTIEKKKQKKMITLLSFEVKNELCPFESVKVWKYGYSVSCSRSTRVTWCSKKENKELLMIDTLKRKHSCSECFVCSRLMFGFSKKMIEGKKL